jgi:fucose permease
LGTHDSRWCAWFGFTEDHGQPEGSDHFTVLALVCLTAALFGSAKISLFAFPAVGFFASVMYPIIFSLALNSVNEHHGSFSGILCTGIIGGAIVPLIIGWLGDHWGLRSGMLFLYITMGYI